MREIDKVAAIDHGFLRCSWDPVSRQNDRQKEIDRNKSKKTGVDNKPAPTNRKNK
jgi:hypothetical protein